MSHQRTPDNAPPEVKERGGVAMSLWLTGGSVSDCVIVTYMSNQCEKAQAEVEKLREALDRIADGEGNPQAARIAEAALRGPHA
jgi:hypothetical protein